MAVFTSCLNELESFERQHCIGTSGREIFFAADKLDGGNSGRGAICVLKRNIYSAQALQPLVNLPFQFTPMCSSEPEILNASTAVYELSGNYIYVFACGSFDDDDDEPTMNIIQIDTKSGDWKHYRSAIPLFQRLQFDQKFEFSVEEKNTTLRFIRSDNAFVELALYNTEGGQVESLKLELDSITSELIIAEKWSSFEVKDGCLFGCVERVGKNWFAFNGGDIYKFDDLRAPSPIIYSAQKAAKRTLKKFASLRMCRGADAGLSLVAEPLMPCTYSSETVESMQRFSRFFVFDVKFDDLRRTFGLRLSTKSVEISTNVTALFNTNRYISDLRVCRCDDGQLVLQRCYGNTSLTVFVGQMSLFRAAFLAFQKAISAAEVGDFEEVSGGVEKWVDSVGFALDFK